LLSGLAKSRLNTSRIAIVNAAGLVQPEGQATLPFYSSCRCAGIRDIFCYLRASFLYPGLGDDRRQAMPASAASKANPKPPPSLGVILGGLAFRTLFIIALIVLTARVASPQIEKLSTVLETPHDLIRVALGFALCVWCAINIFILPKDAEAYRTWLYLGLAVIPLALLCTFVIW
jgi:hypothetical protein